jgi:iron complex outermembrane receptor protein
LPTYIQAAGDAAGCELGKEGGQSYAAGRMNLRWVAGEEGKVEVNVAASFVNDDSQSQPGVLIAANDHSGSGFAILSPTLVGSFTPNPTFLPGASGFVPSYYDNNNNGTYEAGTDVPYDSRFVTGGTYTNYATYINDGNSTPSPLFQGGTPGADTAVYKPYVIEPINHLNSSDVSLNLDWQITENTSLLWVYAIREYENEFAEDTDGSPIAVQQLLQIMDHEQWTQELRLNTSFGDGFADLTLGAFYLDQDTAEDARVDLPYVGFDFIHGPDKVPATNQAVYAHLAFHLGDRTDLSLGVRYSEDEKSYTFRRRNPDLTPVQPCANLAPGFPNPFFWEAINPANCGVFGLDLLSTTYSSDNTDYRIALSRDIGDATMVYGQFSTGYKAGGNNARPFFPAQLNVFQPETLDSIEVGMKSTLGGNTRLNMAVFFNDYADIQLPVTLCYWAPPPLDFPCASQDNVGDADVWGFEIEAEWHPGDRATIDASYSMLDFEYTRVDPLSSVTVGMITPYTPENKISFGAQYEFAAGSGTLTPRIDASFQDDVFGSAINSPNNFIEGYTLVNARLTWESMNEEWRLALEATNITDEYYYLTKFDLMGPVGYVHGQPGRPAEYALSVNRSF